MSSKQRGSDKKIYSKGDVAPLIENIQNTAAMWKRAMLSLAEAHMLLREIRQVLGRPQKPSKDLMKRIDKVIGAER